MIRHHKNKKQHYTNMQYYYQPQKMEKIVLCVDIEVFQHQPKWTTIGIMVAKYPCGSILDMFETGCVRQTNTIAPDKRSFWNKYPDAYEYNIKLCKNKKVYEEEKRISAFVSKWMKKHPNLYIISDNPAFDIAMLQTIYQNNAQRNDPTQTNISSITIREGQYYQPVCIWTMKRCVQLLTGTNIKYLKQKNKHHAISNMAHDKNNILHTPLYDASKIIDEYFLLLDFIHNMNVQQY